MYLTPASKRLYEAENISGSRLSEIIKKDFEDEFGFSPLGNVKVRLKKIV